jgi:lysophospholipase L1-like esterase
MITILLIAALGAVALLLLSEAASRVWLKTRSRYYVWPPSMRQEIRLAGEVFPELEPRVRFDINRDGERGDEAPRDSAGLFRVLATGGSAVECFALDQPTSWPAGLERLLNQHESLQVLGARRVHVGNIAHSGVGAEELDLILERVLPQYERLDLVLIMVGASDVYHWIEQGAPPSRPATVVPESLLFGAHPNQTFGWKPGALALAEIARRLRRRWLRPLEVKERAGAWQANARRMRAAATDVRDTLPDAAAMVQHFEEHFRRACRHAMARADRVLVLLQPWFEGPYTPAEAARFWHGGVGRPWKETISAYYSLEVVNRLLDLVHGRAAQVADELGIEQLNLRRVLTQRVRHYFDHDHFTPAGAALVAQTVANAVLRRSAIATEPTRSSGGAPRVTMATAGHHLEARLR